MRSSSRRSAASKTNRLFALFAVMMFATTVGASFMDDKYVDPDAAFYNTTPDPEYLRVKMSPYPFKDSVPARDAVVLDHPFQSGIFQTSNQSGLDQPKYISHLYELSGNKLTCSGWWELHACAIGHTNSGDFLIIVGPASQSANNAMQIDSVDIEVFVPMVQGTKTFASTVLQANFAMSRCEYMPYAGFLHLDQIKVGTNDVFVLSIGGDFLELEDLTQSEGRIPTQQIVIATNSSGMPEVVASYAGSEMSQIAATDRSLLLTYSDGWNSETPNGFTGTNLIELLPRGSKWEERMHRITSMEDPYWVAAFGIGIEQAAKPNLVKPKRVLEYTANLYPDPDTQPICRN